ncbi:MAG TPA: bifunctional phosphoribosyl-AMP cyclohydrolase/phosphoribosyl-ATP diphosphatase HisIE [Thermodesulfobacteriota bacterium]|nr:bifunctional phosphoribosyl-AMP cyclohydrolase/phosphoribosyl-ATP diphosphatase HisIE [Thermodesulfobacteriota bacterium]
MTTGAALPAFDEAGLVPAVCQDADSGLVLMVAWMDAEAWRLTRETGFAHFFSRSRQRIWKKGESSGHTLRVREVRLDCDRDTVLLAVEPAGPACHTGARSCFVEAVEADPALAAATHARVLAARLARLAATIEARRGASPERSYVASLLEGPEDRLWKKLVEEAAEAALAAKSGDRDGLVREMADLWFHALVALARAGVPAEAVAEELARREGVGGLVERAARRAAGGEGGEP